MKSSNATALIFVGSFATLGFVACGSESDATDPGGTGGTGSTTSPTVGGSTQTGSTTRGGATAASGGTLATGIGGRNNGTGGRNNALGGAAVAGFPAIDLTCLQGGSCSAACTAACPGSTTNYSCTCANGTLTCDLSVCTAAIAGDACPANTATGSSCDSATATTCAPSSGGTLCYCSRQSSQWNCF